MKKIFFVGILSILFVSASFAQLRIGATAGLNSSTLSLKSEGAPNFNFKAGFQVGVVADYAITERFSIMPELLFSQRGGQYKMTEEGITITTTSTLNYLQLPVNAAYKFDVGNGSKLFVFAGPYLGYGLSASGKVKSSGVSIDYSIFKFGKGSGDAEINLEDIQSIDDIPSYYLKKLDFGVNVGVGYEFNKIFFKLQCNPGLTNLSNMGGDSAGDSVENLNLSVSVGYYFF